MADAGGVAHFAEGFGFDLTDALAGDFELASDFLEGAAVAIDEAEALFQDGAFAFGEGIEDIFDFVLEENDGRLVGGVFGGFVLDEVSEAGVLAVSDGSLEGDGLLGHLENGADAFDRELNFVRDFFRGGFASVFLNELFLDADEFVDRLDHVHRDTDGARLIGDGAGNGLPNPPSGVGREFIAAAVFKFFHGLHEAHVAFLNEVEEGESAVGVFFGDGNDETEVGLNHFGFGAESLAMPFFEFRMNGEKVLGGRPDAFFEIAELVGEVAFDFGGFGVGGGGVLLDFRVKVAQGAGLFVCEDDEVLDDFLFVEEFGVETLEGGEGGLESLVIGLGGF